MVPEMNGQTYEHGFECWLFTFSYLNVPGHKLRNISNLVFPWGMTSKQLCSGTWDLTLRAWICTYHTKNTMLATQKRHTNMTSYGPDFGTPAQLCYLLGFVMPRGFKAYWVRTCWCGHNGSITLNWGSKLWIIVWSRYETWYRPSMRMMGIRKGPSLLHLYHSDPDDLVWCTAQTSCTEKLGDPHPQRRTYLSIHLDTLES